MKKGVEKIYKKIIHDKIKIINYSWYCAAAKHHSNNFGFAVHDDDENIYAVNFLGGRS